MKNRFVDTCRAIKRAIFRVLRYRKLPRSTKIQIGLNDDLEPQAVQVQQLSEQPGGEELPEEESKRYDNEIKNFKRLLAKDQSETIKKWTKITIKWENGEWAISEFSSENVDSSYLLIQKRRPVDQVPTQRAIKPLRKASGWRSKDAGRRRSKRTSYSCQLSERTTASS
jgi:hypothetical protein